MEGVPLSSDNRWSLCYGLHLYKTRTHFEKNKDIIIECVKVLTNRWPLLRIPKTDTITDDRATNFG